MTGLLAREEDKNRGVVVKASAVSPEGTTTVLSGDEGSIPSPSLLARHFDNQV